MGQSVFDVYDKKEKIINDKWKMKDEKIYRRENHSFN